MKKSILYGALAIFAISAMSVQNVQAQDNNKKATTTSVTSTKPAQKQDKPVFSTASQNDKEVAPKACETQKCPNAQKCDVKKAGSKSCVNATKDCKAESAVKPDPKKLDAKKKVGTERSEK